MSAPLPSFRTFAGPVSGRLPDLVPGPAPRPGSRALEALPSATLPHVWQGQALATPSGGWSSGHPALDAELPGGGWPLDGLVEVLQPQPGRHLWTLLLPALVQAIRQQPGPVVLVGAPWQPFGPALAAQGLPGERLLWVRGGTPAARLWATEQALRCADVVAVLAWLPQARADALRRLQLAVQQQPRLLFVCRTPAVRHESSPARLRLLLEAGDPLQVHILKRRGPPLQAPVCLPAHPQRLATLLATRQATLAPAPGVAPVGLPPASGGPVPARPDALDRPVTA